MATVAIKYCGGCNPRYDRVAFARDLQRDFPDWEILGADAPSPDFILVVCGCPVRCAAHDHLHGRKGKFSVASPEDRESLYAALRGAEGKPYR